MPLYYLITSSWPVLVEIRYTMSAKQRLQGLSQQLAEGIPDAGKFEDIPKIRQVASDSVGP